MTEQLANSSATTLNGGINDSVTSLTVTNGTLFPSSGNFRILVDSELILVGARSGNTLSSLTRGIEGTTAAAHSNGATVTHLLTKGGLDLYLSESKTLPGSELVYVERTTNLTVTATTEAASQDIVSAGAYTFDGTPVMIEFFCPAVQLGAGNTSFVVISLWDSSTELARIAQLVNNGETTGQLQLALYGRHRLTPTAASHTYIAKAYRGVADGLIQAGTGTGGAGLMMPTFIRITKI